MKHPLPNLNALIILSFLLLSASSINAQTRTAVASGDWSNTVTWGGAAVPTSLNNVVINSGVTVTLDMPTAACANLTVNASAGANGLTITGPCLLEVNGNLTLSQPSAGGTSTFSVGDGNLTVFGSITIPGSSTAGRFATVSVDEGEINCEAVVFTGTAAQARLIFTEAGSLNVGNATGGTLGTGGTVTLFADCTIQYDGTTVNQTVRPMVYQNLTLSGSATKNTSGVTVTDKLLIDGTAMVGNTITYSTADLEYVGVSKSTGPELSGAGLTTILVALNAGQTLTLDQNRTPTGDLTIGFGTFDLSTFSLNRSSAGGTLGINNGARLRIGGTNTFPGNYTTHVLGLTSTVEYGGTNQTIAAINADSYGHLTLSGSGIKTFVSETVRSILSIQGTATTAGVTPTYAASAILEYRGSGAQTISDIEFPGTGTNPANLRINNTAGVTLMTAKTINGALSLVNGYLTTTGLLTIGAAGSSTSASGAFVNGSLAKMKNSTSSFDFFVGTIAGGLRTLRITPTSNTATTYTARFFSDNPQTVFGTEKLIPVSQVSECEYWTLDRSGTANATIRLSWSTATCGGGGPVITDPNTLLVVRWSGTQWESQGNSSITPANTVTSNTVTNFSPGVFAIGTRNSPLPVKFADVKAYEKGTGVQIDWSNLTESELVKYVIERSADGQNFAPISEQLPRSNQANKESYSKFDASPLAVNFYRVTAIEFSGMTIYSKILKVDIGSDTKSISVYPNPTRDNQVSVSINTPKGVYVLRIFNNAGQEVMAKQLNLPGGALTQTVEIPASVKAGVYHLLISGDNYRQSKTFIVQ